MHSQTYRGVEQLVARRAHNPEVGGSSPPPATKTNGESFGSPFVFALGRARTVGSDNPSSESRGSACAHYAESREIEDKRSAVSPPPDYIYIPPKSPFDKGGLLGGASESFALGRARTIGSDNPSSESRGVNVGQIGAKRNEAPLSQSDASLGYRGRK